MWLWAPESYMKGYKYTYPGRQSRKDSIGLLIISQLTRPNASHWVDRLNDHYDSSDVSAPKQCSRCGTINKKFCFRSQVMASTSLGLRRTIMLTHQMYYESGNCVVSVSLAHMFLSKFYCPLFHFGILISFWLFATGMVCTTEQVALLLTCFCPRAKWGGYNFAPWENFITLCTLEPLKTQTWQVCKQYNLKNNRLWCCASVRSHKQRDSDKHQECC